MSSEKTDIVVIGAGPGGYAAAFYAASLGKKVILIEKEERLGGVCLNWGCIPSKALLHVANFMNESKEFKEVQGIHFGEPQIELAKLRAWKDSVIQKLAQGVQTLAKAKKVKVQKGRAHFDGSHKLRVETAEGQHFIEFDKAIIAVGSKPAIPKEFDLGNKRIMTSTEALALEDIPESLLVVGGGYIGMELGTVYASLGSRVTLVEAMEQILMGADADLIRPVMARAKKTFKELRFEAKVKKMATADSQIAVVTEYKGEVLNEKYDRVLVAVGRVPYCHNMGLASTQVEQDEKGFIKVNEQQQTSDANIYAIGDVVGGVMLAHKASKEARVAVENICGHRSTAKEVIIPAVVFTDPEVAWAGLTETEAKAKGLKVKVAKFSWAASGRALTFNRTDGLTKLVIEPETERVLGVGIVGHGAGELIAEGVLAIEMGATAKDIALSVHPHPTLSETMMEAAEVFYGHCTHAV